MAVKGRNEMDSAAMDREERDESMELGSVVEDSLPSSEPSSEQGVPPIEQAHTTSLEERVTSFKEQESERSSRDSLGNDPFPLGLAPKIEAILYLRGQPLSIADLIEATHRDREAVEDALIELMSEYAHRDSALEVVETATGYALQLRHAFQSLIHELVPAELGTGALRTLAAIALKSPILQSELIELRGSSAYQQVQELVEQGFVRKRRQSEGRSYWLEVNDKFHQYFEIEQLSQAIQESDPQ